MNKVTHESLISDLRGMVSDVFNMESLFKNKSVLSKKLDKLESLKVSSKDEFSIQWLSIFMFIKNLKDIREKNNGIFLKLRRGTLNQKTSTSWEGERFEVLIAKHLLYIEGITVRKTESPDFTFSYDGTELFLEATIARLTTNKQSSFYKVSSAINKKSKKAYANKSMILSIDVTNIFSNYFSEISIGEDDFYSEFMSYINSTEIAYGAIILHCSLYRPETRTYRLSYDYHELPGCNEKLKKFLKYGFPMQKSNGYLEPIFPKEI